MALFQILIFLLFVAGFLLVFSQRAGIPYPTMLALVGAAVSLLPFAPQVAINPQLALAVFIAPALLDAAYDTSPSDLKRMWIPLLTLAVGAVLLTTATVAFTGWWVAGLPIAAAVALGAIVAPPDAVAAHTVLGQTGFPRRGSLVLRGESLLNDATALLVFNSAVALAMRGSGESNPFGIAIAAPGGILLGLMLGWGIARMNAVLRGTLSSIVVQVTSTFGIWLIAEHLHVSPVLTVIATAMYISRVSPHRPSARDRVRSYGFWAVMVFGLNVLAFLLMGLQLKPLIAGVGGDWHKPAGFALLILIIVIATRFAVLIAFQAAARRAWDKGGARYLPARPDWKVAVLMSWCGMRGLLTLATSFALPADFPGRDMIVLTAMAVVLGTLVIQGLTLKPMMHWLSLAGTDDTLREELSAARRTMLKAGMSAVEDEKPQLREALTAKIRAALAVSAGDDPQGRTHYDEAAARMVAAEREALNTMRDEGRIADDVFYLLEEELDWSELATRPAGAIGDTPT